MPRENLVLKMHTAWAVDNNGIRARRRVRHSGQVPANGISEGFIPPVVKEVDVVRSICLAGQFSDGMDVQPHDGLQTFELRRPAYHLRWLLPPLRHLPAPGAV